MRKRRAANRVVFENGIALIDLERKSSIVVCQIDEADYPSVSKHRWHLKLERGNSYAETWLSRTKRIKIHQLITGENGMDHADGDGLNNVRRNLRVATQQQNTCNQKLRRDSSQGYKGIERREQSWRARIIVKGDRISLGSFSTAEDAARAYDSAAKTYFGEFARLNFGVAHVR